MPGDCRRATQYNIGPDGSGDGIIGSVPGYSTPGQWVGAANDELGNFWIHLGNAGLVEGNYVLGDSYYSAPGTNACSPETPLGGGYWIFPGAKLFPSTWLNDISPINSGHLLWLTKRQAFESFGAAFIEVNDARSLDAKLDDGMPTSGGIRPTANHILDQVGPSQFNIGGAAGSVACINTSVTSHVYNTTAATGSCTGTTCHLCGLVSKMSF